LFDEQEPSVELQHIYEAVGLPVEANLNKGESADAEPEHDDINDGKALEDHAVDCPIRAIKADKSQSKSLSVRS